MKDLDAILENYHLLGYETYTPKEVEILLYKWRSGCQNTPTSVESVENQSKNTPLSLVK